MCSGPRILNKISEIMTALGCMDLNFKELNQIASELNIESQEAAQRYPSFIGLENVMKQLAIQAKPSFNSKAISLSLLVAINILAIKLRIIV